MKRLVFCVVVCLATVAFGQIEDLRLSDAPTNERGFIIASIANNSQGFASNNLSGSVCGQVDFVTAWLTCLNLGWLFATSTSTADGLGITPPAVGGPQDPIISNLTCTGTTTLGNAGNFNCNFTMPPIGCAADNSNVAAISCYFSIGQIAGIAIGAFLLCLLITILPFVLCCICCCCCGCCVTAASKS